MENKKQRVQKILSKTCHDSLAWNLDQLTLESESSINLAFLNAHAVTFCYEKPEFFTSLFQTNYLLRDGIGVKLALKFFGYPETENLNGTDLIPNILKKFKNRKIAIFGASDAALEACKLKLEKNGISTIVCMAHGFHTPEHYLELIKSRQPEIVVLCMGMPKQELLAQTISEQKLCPLVICGGGWADFYSETKKRAPLWVQKLSLEWLHRLAKEPKRLGKRYTLGILHFFYIISISRIGHNK
ncbi:MAG TPA: WecB/TagA/CpsF family glycosyltransferase [Alphaproteobacteria bacterium]|nr:WecB/TagA/CpsF family glycosyltransferase [Alphaproteobacteria bacterium]